MTPGRAALANLALAAVAWWIVWILVRLCVRIAHALVG